MGRGYATLNGEWRVRMRASVPSSKILVDLVEAGGVEPPSEKARREENYVRIRIMIFDLHL
jgi:hypothetical protein